MACFANYSDYIPQCITGSQGKICCCNIYKPIFQNLKRGNLYSSLPSLPFVSQPTWSGLLLALFY